MKIVTVLGARPQFIKASVVSSELAKNASVSEVIIHTGQHFDANMSDIFFNELGMKVPAYQLNIHGGSHGEMTGRMLESIEKVLVEEKPDTVLVYGDTNSTLAGALAAAKLHIPVAHVEAGLRSFNVRMPEEINRILTDRISTWLFAPTNDAATQLRHEGVDVAAIHQVGDVMYDAALYYGNRARGLTHNIVRELGLSENDYVLATVHRAENTDDFERMCTIVDAFVAVSSEMPVVWPLHPRTRGVLEKFGLLKRLEQSVKLIDPVGYMQMVQLESAAAVIATDSGGVQKEAFFHGVPCVTLRDETEWVELIEAGWNHLIPPTKFDDIARKILAVRGGGGLSVDPYGRGDCASRICAVLTGVQQSK